MGLLIGPPAAVASIAAGIIVVLPIYLSGGHEGGAGKEKFASAAVEATASQVPAEAAAFKTGAQPDRAQLPDNTPNSEETVPARASNIEIAASSIAPQFAAIDASFAAKSSAGSAPRTAASERIISSSSPRIDKKSPPKPLQSAIARSTASIPTGIETAPENAMPDLSPAEFEYIWNKLACVVPAPISTLAYRPSEIAGDWNGHHMAASASDRIQSRTSYSGIGESATPEYLRSKL